jgi:hypothetical protein
MEFPETIFAVFAFWACREILAGTNRPPESRLLVPADDFSLTNRDSDFLGRTLSGNGQRQLGVVGIKPCVGSRASRGKRERNRAESPKTTETRFEYSDALHLARVEKLCALTGNGGTKEQGRADFKTCTVGSFMPVEHARNDRRLWSFSVPISPLSGLTYDVQRSRSRIETAMVYG